MSFKFLPTRSEAKPIEIISDFDQLLTKRVGFKINGKVHELKCVSTENYMRITLAYQGVLSLMRDRLEGKPVSEDQIYEAYYRIFHEVVPDFPKDEVKSLKLGQLNGIMNLILKTMTGDQEVFQGEASDKKKTLRGQ